MTADPREGKPSCSEAHRIVGCPGYLYAKRQWENITDTGSDIAESGQRTHDAIECIIDGQPVEIELKNIEKYIATKCAAIQDSLENSLFGDTGTMTKHWVRKRLWMTVNNRKMMSGEPDYIGTNEQGVWFMPDYKRGPKPVPVATKNWQIQSYASLLAYSDELIGDLPFERVYGAIIQPLVSNDPVVVMMTLDDCLRIRHQLIRAIEYGETSSSPRMLGEHCTYCPVRHVCPQGQAMGLILSHKFNDVGSLSDAQLKALYPRMNQIVDMADQIKKKFKERVEAGAIDGYEMYDHPAGYTVEHPNDLWKLIKDYYPSPREYAALLSVPVGQIKTDYAKRWAKMGGTSEAEGLRAWESDIEPHLIAKPTQRRVRKVKDGSTQITEKET